MVDRLLPQHLRACCATKNPGLSLARFPSQFTAGADRRSASSYPPDLRDLGDRISRSSPTDIIGLPAAAS